MAEPTRDSAIETVLRAVVRRLVVMICLLWNPTGCAEPLSAEENVAPDPAPYISVVTDDESPFWSSLVLEYVPNKINKAAGYRICDTSGDGKWKLHFTVLNADRRLAGIDGRGRAAYRTLVEAKAVLYNSKGVEIWRWSGWVDHPSPPHAVAYLGKVMAAKMAKEGFLD